MSDHLSRVLAEYHKTRSPKVELIEYSNLNAGERREVKDKIHMIDSEVKPFHGSWPIRLANTAAKAEETIKVKRKKPVAPAPEPEPEPQPIKVRRKKPVAPAPEPEPEAAKPKRKRPTAPEPVAAAPAANYADWKGNAQLEPFTRDESKYESKPMVGGKERVISMDEAGWNGLSVVVPLTYKISGELRSLLNKVAADSDIQPLEEISIKELTAETEKDFLSWFSGEELKRKEDEKRKSRAKGAIPDKLIRFFPNGYVKRRLLESSITKDKSLEQLNKILADNGRAPFDVRRVAVERVNAIHNRKLEPVYKAFKAKLKKIYETGSA